MKLQLTGFLMWQSVMFSIFCTTVNESFFHQRSLWRLYIIPIMVLVRKLRTLLLYVYFKDIEQQQMNPGCVIHQLFNWCAHNKWQSHLFAPFTNAIRDVFTGKCKVSWHWFTTSRCLVEIQRPCKCYMWPCWMCSSDHCSSLFQMPVILLVIDSFIIWWIKLILLILCWIGQ